MNRPLSFVVVVALLSIASGHALAQSAREGDRIEYDFRDADQVEGRTARPNGDPIFVFHSQGRGSLITPRGSFVPELRETIESK